MLLLIHPVTGDVFAADKGDGDIARYLILDGYNPVGPKGQAAAKKIREEAAASRPIQLLR